MKIDALGDSALILRELNVPAYQIAEAIQNANLPGVHEAVASYETVGVYFDSDLFDAQSLTRIQLKLSDSRGETHEIPVCYQFGDDLTEVSERLEITIDDVIRLHTAQPYRCFAVGFCPGFPYLGYLPEKLCGIPRRDSPRVRIVPGSVAITGRQSGIYPLERPGGWAILGRTPLCLVDVDDGYFPIKAGDEVRFVSIGVAEFGALKGVRL